MSLETKHFYEFKNFRLDPAERVLLRDGKPVSLTPKAFHLLNILVENHGHIVDKEKLMTEIWSDSFVEDGNLAVSATMLRKSLADDANAPTFIETIPRRGYRFIAEVRRVENAAGVNGSSVPENTIRFPGSAATSSESLLLHPKIQSNPLRGVGAATAPKVEIFNEDVEEITPPARPEEISLVPDTDSINRIQPKQRLLFVASILGVLVIGLVGLAYYLVPRGGTPVAGTRSIAVLPLKPINAANRDELYEMGIADALIIKLGSMKGFVVRPLSATRKYADVAQDPLAAGNEQRVDYVLDSSYQLADGKIRITAQLFNVATGQVEEPYKSEKDAGSYFEIQDQVASEIGNLLLARFATTASDTTAKHGTDNEEAYRLYHQGMFLIEKGGFANAKRSIELFDQAISLDPNYAKAWAGKARAHCHSSHFGGNSPDAEYAIAKPAIERAFALDNDLSEAYAVLGVIRTDYDWDFADAEKQFLRAIEIDPTSEIGHRWYARRLAGRGRYDEAIERIKTVIDFIPGSVFDQHLYGQILASDRRYDDAIKQLQRVNEMDPARADVYETLWRTYHMKGDHPRAYESFLRFQRLIGTKEEIVGSYEASYAKGGWQATLQRYVEILKANDSRGFKAYNIAALSALLGEREQAFGYLNRAAQDRAALVSYIVGDPSFDSLRDDPRFKEFLSRAGLK